MKFRVRLLPHSSRGRAASIEISVRSDSRVSQRQVSILEKPIHYFNCCSHLKYLNAIDSPGDCVAGQSYDKCVITIIAALCPSCQRLTTEQMDGSGDHRRSPLIQSVASITQQPLYPAPLWAMGRSSVGGGQGCGGWRGGSLLPLHHLTLTGKEWFRLTEEPQGAEEQMRVFYEAAGQVIPTHNGHRPNVHYWFGTN